MPSKFVTMLFKDHCSENEKTSKEGAELGTELRQSGSRVRIPVNKHRKNKRNGNHH